MLKAFQWQNATLFKKKKKSFVTLVSGGGEPGDGFSVWIATTPSGFGKKIYLTKRSMLAGREIEKPKFF